MHSSIVALGVCEFDNGRDCENKIVLAASSSTCGGLLLLLLLLLTGELLLLLRCDRVRVDVDNLV